MKKNEICIQCPSCGETVTGPSAMCGACSYPFDREFQDRLAGVFFLKDEYDSLMKMNNEFVERLGKISARLESEYSALKAMTSDRSAGAAEWLREKKAALIAQAAEQAPDDTKKGEEKQPKKSDLELRLGQKWLLIAGVITTVFGVGYFLKYSFERGWIGPAGRVAAAYLFGIAILAAGDRFRKKDFLLFGLALIGGGIAVLYFSTFAAFQIYELFGAPFSFALMVLTTALACGLAVAYDNRWLAVLGLIGGFLTPLLLSTGVDNQPVLMGYMTLLNAGILVISFRKEWPLLSVLGFIATYVLFSGWYSRFYSPERFWMTICFLTLFYLIYTAAPLAYHVFRKSEERLRGLAITVPNSFIAFGFSFLMIREKYSVEWVSVITLFYAVVFFAMAKALSHAGKTHLKAFVMLVAKSALFLIITVPILFSGHWITIFWAAQGITLLWAGLRLKSRPLVTSAHVLAGMALFKFIFYDYTQVFGLHFGEMLFKASYSATMAERYATTLLIIASLFTHFFMLRSRSAESGDGTSRALSRVFIVTAASTLFFSLNIETAAFFGHHFPEARFAAITMLWTLFTAATMTAGFRWNSAPARTTAMILFGITMLKVFIIDISRFSTPFRILSFFVLGFVLVAASFLYYRFKDRIINSLASGTKETDK